MEAVTTVVKGWLGFASSQDRHGESCIPGLECAKRMQSIKVVGAGKSRVP